MALAPVAYCFLGYTLETTWRSLSYDRLISGPGSAGRAGRMFLSAKDYNA